mmetsp:Transcript_104984/g.321648  ORF Transcript_104984/g.321648 Transcript_104984/m.321648 type:complete len:209 (-) Transcript_104984:35-661(-)
MIRRVRHLIGDNLQSREVGLDALLKLCLLLARVGVIESEDQLALVMPRVVVVQHRGLRVPDVQVAAGLRREARADLAHLGVRQQPLEVGLVLFGASRRASSAGTSAGATGSGGTTTPRPLPVRKGELQGPQVFAPPLHVRELLEGTCRGLLQALEVRLRDRTRTAHERVASEEVVEFLKPSLRLQAAELGRHRRPGMAPTGADAGADA